MPTRQSFHEENPAFRSGGSPKLNELDPVHAGNVFPTGVGLPIADYGPITVRRKVFNLPQHSPAAAYRQKKKQWAN